MLAEVLVCKLTMVLNCKLTMQKPCHARRAQELCLVPSRHALTNLWLLACCARTKREGTCCAPGGIQQGLMHTCRGHMPRTWRHPAGPDAHVQGAHAAHLAASSRT